MVADDLLSDLSLKLSSATLLMGQLFRTGNVKILFDRKSKKDVIKMIF